MYCAKDLELGREVAIKVLRKELASNRDGLKRFEREARTASALNRPNITRRETRWDTPYSGTRAKPDSNSPQSRYLTTAVS